MDIITVAQISGLVSFACAGLGILIGRIWERQQWNKLIAKGIIQRPF